MVNLDNQNQQTLYQNNPELLFQLEYNRDSSPLPVKETLELLEYLVACVLGGDLNKTQQCADLFNSRNFQRMITTISTLPRTTVVSTLENIGVPKTLEKYIDFDYWLLNHSNKQHANNIRVNYKLRQVITALINSANPKEQKHRSYLLSSFRQDSIRAFETIQSFIHRAALMLREHDNQNKVPEILGKLNELLESVQNGPRQQGGNNNYIIVDNQQSGGASHVQLALAKSSSAKLIESLYNSITKHLKLQKKVLSYDDDNKFKVLLKDMDTLENDLTKTLISLDKYERLLSQGEQDDTKGPVDFNHIVNFVQSKNNILLKLVNHYKVFVDNANNVHKLFTHVPLTRINTHNMNQIYIN